MRASRERFPKSIERCETGRSCLRHAPRARIRLVTLSASPKQPTRRDASVSCADSAIVQGLVKCSWTASAGPWASIIHNMVGLAAHEFFLHARWGHTARGYAHPTCTCLHESILHRNVQHYIAPLRGPDATGSMSSASGGTSQFQRRFSLGACNPKKAKCKRDSRAALRLRAQLKDLIMAWMVLNGFFRKPMIAFLIR